MWLVNERVTQTSPMKNDDYEKAYYIAREILHNRGKKVGCPLYGPDLVRSCTVDGIPLSDVDLLNAAWGETLTHELLKELADNDSLPNCCPEGNDLWQKYCDSMRINLEMLIQQQTAAREKSSATVTQLGPFLRQVEEVRFHSRKSLLEHAAAHNLAGR